MQSRHISERFFSREQFMINIEGEYAERAPKEGKKHEDMDHDVQIEKGIFAQLLREGRFIQFFVFMALSDIRQKPYPKETVSRLLLLLWRYKCNCDKVDRIGNSDVKLCQ